MNAAKIKTPCEIVIPVEGVKDYGLVLVNGIDRNPRNYLHEISVRADNLEARDYLLAAGYHLSHGWRDMAGFQNWVWRKEFDLSVEKWSEQEFGAAGYAA